MFQNKLFRMIRITTVAADVFPIYFSIKHKLLSEHLKTLAMNFTTVLMSFFFIFPIVFNKPIGNEINEIGHFSKNPPFYSTDLFSLNENANENLRMSPIELNFWKKLRDGFLDFLKNAHGHIGK